MSRDGSRVLVAGVGNIFLGDDAFGVEVVRRLKAGPPAAGVRWADFGIRGFDLAYTLLETWELVVFVDAAVRGGSPGALYLLRPDVSGPDPAREPQKRGMILPQVFAFARSLGRMPDRMILVGCEPAPPGGDEIGIGLGEAVQAAVEPAAELVRAIADRALRGEFLEFADGMAGIQIERGRLCVSPNGAAGHGSASSPTRCGPRVPSRGLST